MAQHAVDQSKWLQDAINAQIEHQKEHPSYTTQRKGEAPVEHTIPEEKRTRVVNAPYVGLLGSNASLAACFRSAFAGADFQTALEAAHSAGMVTFLGAAKSPWRSLSTPQYADSADGEVRVTMPSELVTKIAGWGR